MLCSTSLDINIESWSRINHLEVHVRHDHKYCHDLEVMCAVIIKDGHDLEVRGTVMIKMVTTLKFVGL